MGWVMDRMVDRAIPPNILDPNLGALLRRQRRMASATLRGLQVSPG